MPDGLHHARVHNAGWFVVVPPCIISMIWVNPIIPAGIVAGYAIGRWINPDSDIVGMTTAEGYAINELKIFGWVIVAYYTLYAIFFRRMHRSFWTHFPFVSTLIRWVYGFWWLWFMPIVWYDWQLLFLLCTYIGLSVADLGHYISDKISEVSRNSKE